MEKLGIVAVVLLVLAAIVMLYKLAKELSALSKQVNQQAGKLMAQVQDMRQLARRFEHSSDHFNRGQLNQIAAKVEAIARNLGD